MVNLKRARPGQKIVGQRVAQAVDYFKNRGSECERLRRLLIEDSTRIVTVTGRRGIGKSALVAKVLEDLQSHRRSPADEPVEVDGIVYASARTRGISLERVFLDCGRLVGGRQEQRLVRVWASQKKQEEKIDELLDALSGGFYIILLDNLEDELTDEGVLTDEELWLFIEAAIRRRHGPRLLVTSQVPIRLPHELLVHDLRLPLIDGLPDNDGIALLRQLDASGDAGLRDAPGEALRRAVRGVHGVPRALELIAGAMKEDYLNLPTLDELLENFVERGDVLEHLVQERHRRLDDDARLVLRVLAVFRTPVGADAVRWVLHPYAPAVDPRPVLAHLAEVQLAAVDRPTRLWWLHPMDADLAYSELPQTGAHGRHQLERRVAEWYEAIGLPEDSWRSIEDVAAQRLEFTHRMRAGDFEPAASVLCAIDEFMVMHGSVSEVADMHLSVGTKISTPKLRMQHLLGFGLARLIGGPISESVDHFERAQALAAVLGDRDSQAKALSYLGDAYRYLHRLEESVAALRQAIEVLRDGDDRRYLLFTLLQLSLSYTYQHRISKALEICDQMEELLDEVDDPEGRGRMLNGRSAAYLATGQWDAAIEAAEQSIRWYEAADVPEPVGYVQNTLGLAHLAEDRLEAAISAFTEGLIKGSLTEAPRIEGICCYNLAWAYWESERFPEAADAAGRSEEAFRRQGSSDVTASAALLAAAQAMVAADRKRAARGLLVAASSSVKNADLIDPAILAAEAQSLAVREGATGVAEEAVGLLVRLEARRQR
jgi:tetratricopeptide (TPR) repeat protein